MGPLDGDPPQCPTAGLKTSRRERGGTAYTPKSTSLNRDQPILCLSSSAHRYLLAPGPSRQDKTAQLRGMEEAALSAIPRAELGGPQDDTDPPATSNQSSSSNSGSYNTTGRQPVYSGTGLDGQLNTLATAQQQQWPTSQGMRRRKISLDPSYSSPSNGSSKRRRLSGVRRPGACPPNRARGLKQSTITTSRQSRRHEPPRSRSVDSVDRSQQQPKEVVSSEMMNNTCAVAEQAAAPSIKVVSTERVKCNPTALLPRVVSSGAVESKYPKVVSVDSSTAGSVTRSLG